MEKQRWFHNGRRGRTGLGWYSLDEGDNQQERFASYLIAAIQQATGGHCTTSEAMVQKAPVRQSDVTVCPAIYRTGRVAPSALPGGG